MLIVKRCPVHAVAWGLSPLTSFNKMVKWFFAFVLECSNVSLLFLSCFVFPTRVGVFPILLWTKMLIGTLPHPRGVVSQALPFILDAGKSSPAACRANTRMIRRNKSNQSRRFSLEFKNYASVFVAYFKSKAARIGTCFMGAKRRRIRRFSWPSSVRLRSEFLW